ncbi:leucine-rich repeat domain-containing protein [Microscilla marina]|nr:hypothetical protein [Microscilla marina]
MGLFNRKSKAEKISLVLDRDSSLYDDYEEKTNKKWQKDLDKVFRDMKKNGTPDELKDFLAYRYPFHCWEHGLEDMEEIILNTKEMQPITLENKQIPEKIQELIHLEILEITSSSIEIIPNELKYLEKLKTLNLGNNLISKFPEPITGLNNLQELILTRNNLSKIPKSISKLKHLQIIQLNNNEFQIFPEEILNLENLQQLGLMKNNIQEIPKRINLLEKLEELVMTNNPLQSIPNEIKSLNKLKWLALDKTNLPLTIKEDLSKWLPNTTLTF